MFDITTTNVEKETTLEYSTIILEYCKRWILKERSLIPENVNYEQSAIFNILTFSILSIGSTDGIDYLNKLNSNTMKQRTPLRLKELSFQLRMLVGANVVHHLILPGFTMGLQQEAKLSIVDINKIMETYPHIWVIPYLQMANLYLNSK